MSIDADHGYWKWKLLATFMHLGANFDVSTLMQQRWSPFMYDQDVPACESSRLIPKAGHKSLYLKSMTAGNCSLTFAAYRTNGNGGVTLGLSTTHDRQHFDCVLKNPSDIVWHKKLQDGDRNAVHHKWCQRYGWAKGDTTVSPNDELVATLQDTAVDLIITECNNTGWFLCQSNRDTSSFSEKSIRIEFSTHEEDLIAACSSRYCRNSHGPSTRVP